jgi:hypothetical protein
MPFHRTRKSTSWLHTLDNRQQVGELRRAEKSCPLLSIFPCMLCYVLPYASPTYFPTYSWVGWGGMPRRTFSFLSSFSSCFGCDCLIVPHIFACGIGTVWGGDGMR